MKTNMEVLTTPEQSDNKEQVGVGGARAGTQQETQQEAFFPCFSLTASKVTLQAPRNCWVGTSYMYSAALRSFFFKVYF